VPRTLAFAAGFDDVDFVDTSGKADRAALEAAGIRCHRPADYRFSPIPVLNLWRLLRHLAPDLIVCHFCSGVHFFAAIAYGRCPVAGIVMGSDVLYDRGDKSNPALRRYLVRAGLRRSALVSAKSGYLERRCREFGVTGRIAVNYWGADTARFAPGDRAAARRQLALPDDRPIVLSPRTLSPLYNVDLVIAALALVVREHADALLVLIGREVPEYRARLNLQVQELGLQHHVRFVGEVGLAEVPHYYNAADVVVSMARTEGFPNTVLEVMCCRRPLVVGRIEQVTELIEDGREGLLVELEPGSLARGIDRILREPRTAERLAAVAHDKAREVADLGRNGRAFARDLERAAAFPPPGSAPGLATYRAALLLYAALRRLMRW
jgi:glycosyltransferase involved in cell wall biosynthesis